MKFPLFSILLCVLLFASCKSRKRNVQYGYKGCYRLAEGEVNDTIDRGDIEYYGLTCYHDVPQANMMVNRVIKGPQTSFLSLAVMMTPMEFEEAMIKDGGFKILEQSEFGTKDAYYRGYLIKRPTVYLVRTVFTEPGHAELVIYDVIFESDELEKARLFYENKNEIKSRLNCGKRFD